jgi:hypothetical protein
MRRNFFDPKSSAKVTSRDLRRLPTEPILSDATQRVVMPYVEHCSICASFVCVLVDQGIRLRLPGTLVFSPPPFRTSMCEVYLNREEMCVL